MNRVLVFGMTPNPGGVEKVIINYYRNIDRNTLQFDFLCNTHEKVAYEEELLAMGGRTFHITARSENRAVYKKQLEEVFAEHAKEWSAIWVNVSSLANIDYLKIAKKYGISKRIIHSHNSRNMDSKLRGILHYFNKNQIGKYATDFWACSGDAAKWFYNKRLINQAVIIRNAIDIDAMKFDGEKRNAIRAEHGWEDRYIIGNIGRLHFQKNQSFMIDVFQMYHQYYPESLLVIVGQGEDEDMLRTKVKNYKLQNDVFFAGVQSDIQGWLSCFDLFLFPSVFEGLSVVALEAQGNGVPVLASEGVIPGDVKMCRNFRFLSLEKGVNAWKEEIEKMRPLGREEYDSIKKNFVNKGFDIKTEAAKLQCRMVS